ncbi:hypothetical protein [Haloferula sp.]|uniref:hypothetical protein n=1 Tax=Haloferula sp. TaxID=2497595 RepID=UPI00329B81B5
MIQTINYQGWEDAIELSNRTARVVVVPSVGRIMHYGFAEGENLLFVNPEHTGKVNSGEGPALVDGKPDWIDYGGDRLWPTEEDRFEQINGARRPPDWFFDGLPWTSRIEGHEVIITSPVSSLCGASIERRISLDEKSSRLVVHQKLSKVLLGRIKNLEPIPLTIWNISTLRLPEQIFFPLAAESCFEGDVHFPIWPGAKNHGADNYTRDGELGVFLPNGVPQKVGTDAPGWIAALVGEDVIVEQFRADPDASYPDGGTSVTAFLNSSIGEIECLSPQVPLQVGEAIEHSLVWNLGRIGPGALQERREKATKWITSLSPFQPD